MPYRYMHWWLILIVLGLAGCQTAPKPEKRVIPLAGIPVPEAPAPKPVISPAPIIPTPPAPPPQPAPLTELLTLPTNSLAAPWFPYESWYLFNGLQPPESVRHRGQLSFDLRTTNGVVSLSPGSRIAYWNGLGFWLGYSPQLVQGHPHLHILDVQKSIYPLLNGSQLHLGTNAVIVLDPGHGGRNPGTKSILENRYEKEFTLDWALRIQRMLATNGWRVYLTRTNDTDISLSNRVALAEQVHADLFISLHFNSAFPSTEPSGLETYCLTPTGMPSSVTRDFEDDQHQVYPNNRFDMVNLEYALQLHRALLSATGAADRTVRRARFLGVLRGQNRPAVLIEGGYLSNPQEARRIADPRYRQYLGEAVVRALLNHGGVHQASNKGRQAT